MSGFTAEEALEFQGTEDAELITWKCTYRILREHGWEDEFDFSNDTYRHQQRPAMVDAGDLFAWLGY